MFNADVHILNLSEWIQLSAINIIDYLGLQILF